MSQPSNVRILLICSVMASIPPSIQAVTMWPTISPVASQVLSSNREASPVIGTPQISISPPVPPRIQPPRASTFSDITIKGSLPLPTNKSLSIDYGKARASTLISTQTKTIAANFTPSPEVSNSHAAVAKAATQIQPLPSIENNRVNLATIRAVHNTATAARNSAPFTGKAKASSRNAISGISIIRNDSNTLNTSSATPSKQVDSKTLLNVSWTINQLELQSFPSVAFAFLRDTVEIVQQVDDQWSIDQIGFIIYVENGKTTRIPIDSTGNESIATWLREHIVSTENGATVSPDSTLSVPIVLMDTNDPTKSVLLDIQNIHTEASYETPPRAVPQTGGKVGYAPDAAAATNIHWNSENKTLTFDSASINILTNGKANRFTSSSPDDVLLGGSLTIDPLLYLTNYENREYFTGSTLKLFDRDDVLLLQASLPTMVYEDTLSSYQGYDLFAPILNIQQAELGRSEWLDTFLSEIGIDSDYIPELFVDLGPIDDDVWLRSFDTQGTVILSFASPYLRVFAPSPLFLLLPGLFLLRNGLFGKGQIEPQRHRDIDEVVGGVIGQSDPPEHRQQETTPQDRRGTQYHGADHPVGALYGPSIQFDVIDEALLQRDAQGSLGTGRQKRPDGETEPVAGIVVVVVESGFIEESARKGQRVLPFEHRQ